ncbi:MAG: hypothetical protein Q8S13_13160, partial [Dehalococcoidia bacterium]|nr:hypothetical protein [Dehalococcoidia bacterium]
SCIASAFGDRTFNWPYYSLFAMPFLIAAVIGGVLAYYAGVRPRAVLRALRRTIFDHFTARLGRRTASPRTAIHPKETT